MIIPKTQDSHRIQSAAFNRSRLEDLHIQWDSADVVSGFPDVVGAIMLSDDDRSMLIEQLGQIDYGPIGSHNLAYGCTSLANNHASVTRRNELLTQSALKALDATARTFLDFVQHDATSRVGQPAGWDMIVRGGLYGQNASDLSNSLHIDGGPPIVRYVAALVGRASLFAEVSISQHDVSDAGLLYNTDISLQPTKTGDITRFYAFTPHTAPIPDNKSRLFMSATAWL